VVGSFCVRKRTVKLFVTVGNNGTTVSILTTAMLCNPVEASVGTSNPVIVKHEGEVNQYPLTLPGKIEACGGNGI
jgi:hypothetical protein